MNALHIAGLVGLCFGGLFGLILILKIIRMICCYKFKPPPEEETTTEDSVSFKRYYRDLTLQIEKHEEESNSMLKGKAEVPKPPPGSNLYNPANPIDSDFYIYGRKHSFAAAIEGLDRAQSQEKTPSPKPLTPVQVEEKVIVNRCATAVKVTPGSGNASSSSLTESPRSLDANLTYRKKASGSSESSSGISEMFSPPKNATAVYPSLEDCPMSPLGKPGEGKNILVIDQSSERFAAYFFEGGKSKCGFYSYPKQVIVDLMEGTELENAADKDAKMNAMFAVMLWGDKASGKIDLYAGSTMDFSGGEESAVLCPSIYKHLRNYLQHMTKCKGLSFNVRLPSIDQPDGQIPTPLEYIVPNVSFASEPDHFVKMYPAKMLLNEEYQAFVTFICGSFQIPGLGCKGTHEPFRIGNDINPQTHKYGSNLVKVQHKLEDWMKHNCQYI